MLTVLRDKIVNCCIHIRTCVCALGPPLQAHILESFLNFVK